MGVSIWKERLAANRVCKIFESIKQLYDEKDIQFSHQLIFGYDVWDRENGGWSGRSYSLEEMLKKLNELAANRFRVKLKGKSTTVEAISITFYSPPNESVVPLGFLTPKVNEKMPSYYAQHGCLVSRVYTQQLNNAVLIPPLE